MHESLPAASLDRFPLACSLIHFISPMFTGSNHNLIFVDRYAPQINDSCLWIVTLGIDSRFSVGGFYDGLCFVFDNTVHKSRWSRDTCSSVFSSTYGDGKPCRARLFS